MCALNQCQTSLLIVCELCHKPFSTIARRTGYLGNTKGRPSQTSAAATAIGTCQDFLLLIGICHALGMRPSRGVGRKLIIKTNRNLCCLLKLNQSRLESESFIQKRHLELECLLVLQSRTRVSQQIYLILFVLYFPWPPRWEFSFLCV